MTDFLGRTFELARQLLDAERRSPSEPALPPHQVETLVDVALPRRGRGEDELYRLLERVVAATPKTSSRRFFNQLFAGREPAAAAGELLASLLNTSMYTYKVGGVHVLIEREVTRRMAELAGFPDGDGTEASGGSLANLVAMIVARNEAAPQFRDHGAGAPGASAAQRLVVYVSDEGHYSIRKNAGMIGIGRSNVRRVPIDALGRMDARSLAAMLDLDRAAGALPVCVVATAGTTVAGAFDPIRAIAEITRRAGVWLHVDGAFGGSFLLHPELRAKLDGLELADSFAWNPHKMMGIPLPCSMILMRQRGLLHKHFNETADYLFQQDDADLNLGTKSIQCGRRNNVLKLWAAWQALGDQGWAARIERQVALARYAAERIRRDPELLLHLEPECLNVCFEVREKPSQLVCERLSDQGLAVIGYGLWNGRKVIRLVTVNPEVSEHEIDRLLADTKRVAAALPQTAAASSVTAP